MIFNLARRIPARFAKRTLGVFGGLLGTGTVFYFNSPTCFAKDNQSFVFSWGSGQYGQVGNGGERNVPSPLHLHDLDTEEIVFCSAGSQQSAAITKSGRLFTWGRSQDRRLGHGDAIGSNESYPKVVAELEGKKAVFVDAGFAHMACITGDGSIYTWGKNSSKQLGHPKSDYPAPVLGLPSDANFVQVACGRNHTLALTEDGEVYSWGGSKKGAQGTGKRGAEPVPTPVHALSDLDIKQIACGEDFSLFLTKDGNVYSCGASDFGQTGHGRTSRYSLSPEKIHMLEKHNITRMACGQYHSLICTEEGDVYSWGFNKDGQLGHGDNFHRHTPSKIIGLTDREKATDLAAGHGHSAVIMNDGASAYIFGRGRSGQIGRASETESIAAYRATPVEVNFFKNNGLKIGQVCLGSDHSLCMTN